MPTREHTRPLSQVEVEIEIERIVAELEQLTEDFAVACREEAEAENAYKRTYHRAYIVHTERGTLADGRKTTVGWVEAQAGISCEDQQSTYRIHAARVHSMSEALRTKRASLDALRTISANIRSQT